ncbi:MAG TPA: TolC family protein [Chitinophagaceae bacterium]|nr:TolC family protein [Chitinophagaceae bacterium]
MEGRKYKLVLIVAAFVLTYTAQAQHRYEFTAQQAADYARKNNTQVKNALVGVQIQQQTNKEITAAAYPQVNGNVSTGYNPNVAVQQFPNFIAAATYGVLEKEGVQNGTGQSIISPGDFGFIQAAFGSKFNASYGVSLQQLLFEGQVFVGLQARKASIDYVNKVVEVTEENIRANIYKIYYQLAASKAQLQMLDANIALLQKLQNDQRVMFENGFAEKLDVNRALVQLANVETQKTKALNSIENGYLGLKVLMGMPVKDTLVLTDSITYDNIREGVLENLAYRHEDRKEYQLAQFGKQLRQYDIKRYKLTYFPTVALSTSYSRISQSNKYNFFGGASWFPASAIGLNISVPIFDGFARSARIQRARLQLQQTENEIESLKLGIDRDVDLALNNYKSALTTLDNQKKVIDLAQQVYNQAKLKREQGMGTTLEITSAQSDLQIAQSNYISALYDAINAKVDFLKGTGKLQ